MEALVGALVMAAVEAVVMIVVAIYAAMISWFSQGWWDAVLRGLERLGRLARRLRRGIVWLFGVARLDLSPQDRAARLAAWALLVVIVLGLVWR